METTNAVILSVDDDRDILEIVRLTLATAGYEVITAQNGADALRLALKNQPSLVLLDAMMPAWTATRSRPRCSRCLTCRRRRSSSLPRSPASSTGRRRSPPEPSTTSRSRSPATHSSRRFATTWTRARVSRPSARREPAGPSGSRPWTSRRSRRRSQPIWASSPQRP